MIEPSTRQQKEQSCLTYSGVTCRPREECFCTTQTSNATPVDLSSRIHLKAQVMRTKDHFQPVYDSDAASAPLSYRKDAASMKVVADCKSQLKNKCSVWSLHLKSHYKFTG